MIIFDRLGGWGLGNSLFQIATTMAIAIDNNTDFYFPDNCAFVKKKYINYLKNQIPIIDTKIYNEIYFNKWGIGDPIKYIKPPLLKNAIIDGFFQTDKYFIHIRDKILEFIDIKDEYKIYLKNKYENILNNNSCSIHVRRGDYLTAKEMKVLSIDIGVKNFALWIEEFDNYRKAFQECEQYNREQQELDNKYSR
jgi:hypothetical protein